MIIVVISELVWWFPLKCNTRSVSQIRHFRMLNVSICSLAIFPLSIFENTDFRCIYQIESSRHFVLTNTISKPAS